MEYITKALVYGVHAYHSITGCLQRWLPHSVEYKTRWKLCDIELREVFIGDTREEFYLDDEFPVLFHEVRRKNHTLTETEYRVAIHWADFHRPPYIIEDLFQKLPAPWFFIGYRDGEETIDCTEELNPYICYGNFIDIRLLNFLVPQSKGKQWVYIHTKTLDETEFPSDGIIIDDPDAEEPGDKKND